MTHQGAILVVDDSLPSLQFLTEVLIAAGYEVHAAHSGELGLASVVARPPELILLDIRMPGLDGFEVLRRLKAREESRAIPVLFLSAATEAAERVEGLRLGAVDFISKPFHNEELLARVRTHLEMFRLRARLEQQTASLQSANDRLQSEMAQRQRAQETLAASERKFQATLYSIGDAVITTDTGGRVQEMNRVAEALTGWTEAEAFTSLTGYSAEEAVGRNPRELVKSGLHDRALYKDLWDTLLAGNVWHGEMTNRRKDGSLYAEEQTITPVRDVRGEIAHFIAIKRDLTKEKQLQAQLLQSQKMESVGQLAGGIAHDFNNLLTVISGTADLASRRLRDEDPLRADFLQIQRAGDRAASLTRQLLAFSRKQMMKPSVLNLNTLAADLSGMLQRLIGEDIDLVVVPARGVGSVRADPGQIEQVILNLALNARDCMPSGGRLTIETRDVELDEAHAARHPSVVPGPHVMLSVSDTGVGMDEATRVRIFEPFFTTKEPGKGTGLGLSTVYGIVKQSGGSIWVYSELGMGTTFKVYLPRVEEAAPKGQPARPVLATEGTETILVVEDEDTLRELVKEVLQSAGYTVLMAGNGGEALLLLARHQGPVHLLLTDVVMPGISGRDLAARVVDSHPEIKVLYTSGYTDDAILRHGVLDETTSFIPKPYAIEDLTRKVREVLDSPSGRPATST